MLWSSFSAVVFIQSGWVFSNINDLNCQIMLPSVDDILTFLSLSRAMGVNLGWLTLDNRAYHTHERCSALARAALGVRRLSED